MVCLILSLFINERGCRSRVLSARRVVVSETALLLSVIVFLHPDYLVVSGPQRQRRGSENC